MKNFLVAAIAAAAAALGQEQISVPLSDPSRPATVRIESMRGDITMRGHDGKDIVIASKSGKPSRRERKGPSEMDGLKRIDIGGGGFNAEERDNVVTIGAGLQGADIDVAVPRSALLKVKTMSGEITVEGIRGEIEANSLNGEVTITDSQGTVVAHSLNGDVKVVLTRVESKPMAFSTMNGDIDVSLPADVKARLKIRNDHGEVYSDFDMKVTATPQVEQGSKEDGKYKVKFERFMTADINGGGPEISFRSVNGRIKIRKNK